MNTWIIIGIIAVIGIAIFFVTRSRSKKFPPLPVPKPVEPLPEPIPAPAPKPVELALPVPPPMPAPGEPPPPLPVEQRFIIGHSTFLLVGDDLGKAINAVQGVHDARELVITEPRIYELRTPVILRPGIRLRLQQGVTIVPRTEGIPFRLMEGASIIGEQDSVITESSVPGQWTVIAGFHGTEENGRPDLDITLYGFEVRGSPERKDFNSTQQAVSLGNCKKFSVEKVHINGTHAIGMQAGGTGLLGHAAEDGRVAHCRFTRVASQSLALVNGRRIVYEYNFFEASGQPDGPGSHPIDLEVNNEHDALEDVIVRKNWLDFRESSVFGNGIIAQATTGTLKVGNILIEENVLLGGNPYPPVTNNMSSGIYVYGATMKDVTVGKNQIWRAGHAGLNLEGTNINAHDNELVNCGGGGVPGARLFHMSGEFKRNKYLYTGHGPADSRLLITNSNVVLEGNEGFEVVRE